MAEYDLLTTWRIHAPLEEVYAAIHDSPRWPEWWPAVKEVRPLSAGNADGTNSVWRYSWQGSLPYRLVFEVLIARVENLVQIEGIARGDLVGNGSWHFSQDGMATVVRYEWHVQTSRWWMNLLAPTFRALFIRNHAHVMTQGAHGLCRRLKSSLISEETTDLMVGAGAKSTVASGCAAIGPATVLFAGVAAGVTATMAQIILWWLSAAPVSELLLRDARLTAAIALGRGVLAPPLTMSWYTLFVATLIHFSLSTAYALILAYIPRHLRTGPALLAGAGCGAVIYVINLYGFTLLYPWFEIARGGITLMAHLVFGMAAVGALCLLRNSKMGRVYAGS